MFIIQKKGIQIIAMCMLIGLISFTLKTSKEENDTIETTATPVSGKTIVVDAGHGTPDERCGK